MAPLTTSESCDSMMLMESNTGAIAEKFFTALTRLVEKDKNEVNMSIFN